MKSGRWRAQIYFETHNYYLGTYDTQAEAAAARQAAERLLAILPTPVQAPHYGKPRLHVV